MSCRNDLFIGRFDDYAAPDNIVPSFRPNSNFQDKLAVGDPAAIAELRNGSIRRAAKKHN